MDGVGEHVGRRRIFLELCIVSPMNKSNSRPVVFYRLPRTGVGPGARCKTGAPRARARPAPAPSARKAPGARQPASDNVKGDAVRVSHVTTCVSYQVSHP